MLMILASCINVFPMKPITSKGKSALEEKKQSKSNQNGSSKWFRRKAFHVYYRQIEKPSYFFKILNICPARMLHKRVVWIVTSWKTGSMNSVITGNCPMQPSILNSTNIQLVFLPPNTSSVLQPMDQGFIRSFKAYYRGWVVRLLCRALEKREFIQDFNFTSNEDTCWLLYDSL